MSSRTTTQAAGVASITRSHQRLLDAAFEIGAVPDPDADSIAFMARRLVQCTLPQRSPGQVPAWARRTGRLTLTIRHGWDHRNGQQLGYPCGSIPRLLLFWITTEATRTKSRRLELSDSLAGFMREIGLDPSTGGGKRGDAARLRDQMTRLFRATISFDEVLDNGDLNGDQWLDMAVAPMGQLWWDPKLPEQSTLFGSWIELGEACYESSVDAPVPVDLRALRALKQSPMSLDLYAWLTFRTFRVSQRGKPAFVPWAAVRQQLGSDFSDLKNFKKCAKKALVRVQAVYPDLRVRCVDGGIEVHPSRPAVLPVASFPRVPLR